MAARRRALITGSSRGIGRGIALALAEEQVDIAIHYFENESAAHETLAEVRKRGADGFIVQADVRNIDSFKQIFARVKNEFGSLDIFVSNARPELPTFFQPPLDLTTEQWDTAVDSQAKAFLVGARDAMSMMSEGGRIIAITYAEGSRTGGLQPWVAMGAAKAAMESLIRYLAVAAAPSGITVNAVSPGWIEGSVLNTLPEQAQELIRNWHKGGWTPMRRLGTPKDVGNVVSLLCSEKAQWITGQIIYADGGSSLMNPEVPPEIQIG